MKKRTKNEQRKIIEALKRKVAQYRETILTLEKNSFNNSFLSSIFDDIITDKQMAQRIFEMPTEQDQEQSLDDCALHLKDRSVSILWEYDQLVSNSLLQKELGDKIPKNVLEFLKSLPHNHRTKIVATTVDCFNNVNNCSVDIFLGELISLGPEFKIIRTTEPEMLLAKLIEECLLSLTEAHPFSLVSKRTALKVIQKY